MEKRRDFLKKTSLITAAGLLAGRLNLLNSANTKDSFIFASKKNIGLQIYSLGGELYENLKDGLKRISKMGYSTIELAGYKDGKINNVNMLEFKKIADDEGVKIVSSHLNPPTRVYTNSNIGEISEFWKKAADDHAKIGVKYIIQPGQPITRSTEEVSLVCKVFNNAGKIAKEHGLSFGYHNHEMEFSHVIPGGKEMIFGRRAFGRNRPVGTEVIYDGFLKQTDPELVVFELDVYWTVMGQNDPVEYMQKYPERIKLLHLKDKGVLGQSGMMNFEQIFNQAYKNEIEEFFVELDDVNSGYQYERVKKSAEFLHNSGYVK